MRKEGSLSDYVPSSHKNKERKSKLRGRRSSNYKKAKERMRSLKKNRTEGNLNTPESKDEPVKNLNSVMSVSNLNLEGDIQKIDFSLQNKSE